MIFLKAVDSIEASSKRFSQGGDRLIIMQTKMG